MSGQKGVRLVTGAALLAVCGAIAVNAVSAASWRLRMEDTENQLSYSRQRERKQQVELAEVQESIPRYRQTLEELLPMRDIATSEEADLREQRKQARATDKTLTETCELNQKAAEDARASLLAAIVQETTLLNKAGSQWFAAQPGHNLTACAQEVQHGQ